MARDCNLDPFCVACQTSGHRSDQMKCPVFRNLVNSERDRRESGRRAKSGGSPAPTGGGPGGGKTKNSPKKKKKAPPALETGKVPEMEVETLDTPVLGGTVLGFLL